MRAVLMALALFAGCRSTPGELWATDIDGQAVRLAPSEDALSVLLFLRTDCPISSRYAPEIQRLSNGFADRGVRLWSVYPVASEEADAVRAHHLQYALPGVPLGDPSGALVRFSGAKVTPEAAVISREGRLLYHGRIDDRFVAYGKERAEPTSHDLEQAIESALRGQEAKAPSAPAIGCYLPEVK
jgi:hypothetical protein